MSARNIAFAFVLIGAVMIAAIPTASAQEPVTSTPAPELAYYDAQIDVLIPRLIAFQDQYHELTGHYYQALQSNSTAPNVPTVPDGLSGAPTDQTEDLAYFWTNGAELPSVLAWSFSINTYVGMDGEGYVLNVSTALDDVTWKKAVNFGPEEWRTSDWYQLVMDL